MEERRDVIQRATRSVVAALEPLGANERAEAMRYAGSILIAKAKGELEEAEKQAEARERVVITGVDFLIVPTGRPMVSGFIAANKRAESLLWKLSQGNTLRTMFGLTLYAEGIEAKKEIIRKLRENNLTYADAHV